VQPIPYAPANAHGMSRLLCRERRRRNVIGGLETAAIGKLGTGLRTDDGGDARQLNLASKAAPAMELNRLL
jgi:hypothetical protein